MVSEQKKQLVQSLVQDIQKALVIGVVNMSMLPAQQLQVMKATLRKKNVSIVMARKRLLQRALTEANKPNILQLTEKIKGMPALLFSNENPFTLYSIIQKNKSEAPAKAGQISPRDIVVKAGPTNFAPGPIISELAAVGIKTKVEAGKLAIMADTTIVKEGGVISNKVSETLKRLDIKPMEIGLDLVAVWENGLVFDAKQLHIDEVQFARDLTQAASWAMNLAVDIAYPAADTMELLLQKVFRDTKAVALEANYLTEETRADILAKAERQALAIKEEGKIEAQVEPKAKEPVHPNFGKVSEDEAQELLEKLKKEGTLR